MFDGGIVDAVDSYGNGCNVADWSNGFDRSLKHSETSSVPVNTPRSSGTYVKDRSTEFLKSLNERI